MSNDKGFWDYAYGQYADDLRNDERLAEAGLTHLIPWPPLSAEALIERHQWEMCRPWMQRETDVNCARSLLHEDEYQLPDHVCDEVGAHVSLFHAVGPYPHPFYTWVPAHVPSSPRRYFEVPEAPEGVDVFLQVTRVQPDGGRCVLFGITRATPGAEPVQLFPEPVPPWVPATVEECIIRASGTGAELEPDLRSWYDRLFRGIRSGPQGWTPYDRKWLREAFDKAHSETPDRKPTVQILADRMGVSKSKLERAMKHGVIPRRKYW